MKKIIACLLAVVTLLTFSLTAIAADVEFVPSITNKGAPTLVVTVDGDGNKVIGYIRDENGNIISTEHEDCLIITPVSEAETSKDIPDDARDLLLKVYDELNKTGTKLSELCPELNDIVAAALGANKDADDLVVRDLFDVTELCDDIKTNLPKDGNVLDLTFDLSIGKDQFITAMVYVDGKWQPVKTVNNGDGTVTCSFEKLCPVAFLVPTAEGTSAPKTGDAAQTGLIFWGCVLAVSAAAMVTLGVYRRKSTNK